MQDLPPDVPHELLEECRGLESLAPPVVPEALPKALARELRVVEPASKEQVVKAPVFPPIFHHSPSFSIIFHGFPSFFHGFYIIFDGSSMVFHGFSIIFLMDLPWSSMDSRGFLRGSMVFRAR